MLQTAKTQMNKTNEKPISRALRELRKVLTDIAIVDNGLYAIAVFLFFVFILALVRINWIFALIPFLIALAYGIYNSFKSADYLTVEKRFPDLRERLRTVADNLDKDNEIINQLHKEVLAKIKQVKTSYFMPFGKLTKKLGMIILFSYAIIFSAALDIYVLDFASAVENAKKYTFLRKGSDVLADFAKNDSGIFGDSSIAKLGSEEIKIQLAREATDIDISRLEDIKEKEFKESYPAEIYAKTSSGFEEDIPKNYKEIVKKYYTGISKER